MYTAKSVAKAVSHGALNVTVEFADGTDTFSETYMANSGVDPYWLQNRVNNKLNELNTLSDLAKDLKLGEIPEGYGKPNPTEVDLFVQNLVKLKQLQSAVSLGLLEENDADVVACEKDVKDGFKKEYLTSVRLS